MSVHFLFRPATSDDRHVLRTETIGASVKTSVYPVSANNRVGRPFAPITKSFETPEDAERYAANPGWGSYVDASADLVNQIFSVL